MRLAILWFLLLGFFSMSAQVTNEGKPKSWSQDGISVPAAIVMPRVDVDKLRAEDALNDLKKDAPWRFGFEMLVDYNLDNSGEWSTLKNGDRIWRIRFSSKGARTLNFLFSDFFMPAGASVYLYNNSRTDLLGAYDATQNNEERVLGTWLVSGDDVWIEYYEPAAVKGQGNLEIFKVVHGYRSSDDYLKSPDNDLNASGSCNYDVNCSIAAINEMKERNKNSVALMIANSSGFCTGALINNTSNNGVPYFLTANHCYSNPATWSFRFKWISPNPVCAQNVASTNASNVLTISGATLRARRAESDFCLVEINNPIPASWNLLWAGWDRSTTPPPFSFGIHHPSGDIMKVCYDANPPQSFDNAGNYWMVQDWDMGVTEGGSSGSPLFNNNGRIIGQLWRGSAACVGTNDNGGSDDYGRFNVSWATGSSQTSRLKEWLDPTNSGVTSIDSYPPAEVFANNLKAVIIGVPEVVCGNSINPVVRITNTGSAMVTSALISYSLNVAFPDELPWNGSLAPGASTEITLPVMPISGNSNVLYVNVEGPNGVADQYPADNYASVAFVKAAAFETSQYTFAIQTDNYGSETTWNIRNAANVVVASGGPYQSNTSNNQSVTLPQGGCYTFTIYDTEGDGICCGWGNGSYSLSTAAGATVIAGGDFGSSQTITFEASAPLSVESATLSSVVVYPNPSSARFHVSLNSSLEYAVTNILGQTISTGMLEAGSSEIDLGSHPTGMYVLTLIDGRSGSARNIKLIKQ